MDRSATAVVAAALLAAAGCGDGAARPAPPPLTSVPAAWTFAGPAAGDTTAILWAFRTEDCLSCMGVDYDVRRVQARFGPAVPLIALHVGSEGESAIPRAYFRTRRLRVDHTVTLAPGGFRELYPGVALPALFLLQGRRVAWSTAGTRSTRIQLDTLVQRLRQGLPPTDGTQSPRAPGAGGGT